MFWLSQNFEFSYIIVQVTPFICLQKIIVQDNMSHNNFLSSVVFYYYFQIGLVIRSKITPNTSSFIQFHYFFFFLQQIFEIATLLVRVLLGHWFNQPTTPKWSSLHRRRELWLILELFPVYIYHHYSQAKFLLEKSGIL